MLFGHIMTTLNDTFEREITQEDEGYESGSKSLSIPTPLKRAPQIYYISTSENLSFILPHHLPQLNNTQTTHHHHLVFNSSDNESPLRTSDPHL